MSEPLDQKTRESALDLATFAEAALCREGGDGIAMRSWLLEADRTAYSWQEAKRPDLRDPCALAIVAGLVEHKAGDKAPAWTRSIGPAPRELTLMPGPARTLARLRDESPEPLRSRNVLASPNFDVVV